MGAKADIIIARQALLDTGRFTVDKNNIWLLHVKTNAYRFNVITGVWMRGGVEVVDFEEVFQAVSPETKEAFLWHLDILR